MKQTTITLNTQEEIIGLTLIPVTRQYPNEFHRKAWELLTKQSDLIEKFLCPAGEFDPRNNEDFAKLTAWEKETLERIDRVVRNREFQTKVKVLRARPDGTPFQWKVTVFWNRPAHPKTKDTPGIWTLLRISKGGQRRVVAKIANTLECFGDELYEYLPEDIGEYDVEPDGAEISIAPKEGSDYYLFRFHATRN